MGKSFHLKMIDPNAFSVEIETDSLVVPVQEGSIGILADHQPMIAHLKSGLVKFHDSLGQWDNVFIDGGYLSVLNNSVNLLADKATRLNDLDQSEAERLLEEALKVLRGESSSLSAHDAMLQVERASAILSALQIVE